MKRKHMWWLIAALVVVLIGATLWGPIVSNVEQPNYKTLESSGNIEIRDYAPMIVTETQVTGEREEALNKGFRIIADYIFGNNTVAQKVPMTAPVTQQGSEKIAMTAPVTQQGDGNTWKVHFIMPSSYTMEELPRPNNPALELKEIGAKRYVVIRFSGLAGEDSLKRYSEELNAFLGCLPEELGEAVQVADVPGRDMKADRNERIAGRPSSIMAMIERRCMLAEQPRLFFVHFWAEDDAVKLATSLT